MTVEFADRHRQELIQEYSLIFETYPELKKTAQKYWTQVRGMNSKQERMLFDKAVLEISNQLLDNEVFLAAMDQEGKDPIECAIIESFSMIDIVPDV